MWTKVPLQHHLTSSNNIIEHDAQVGARYYLQQKTLGADVAVVLNAQTSCLVKCVAKTGQTIALH